MRVQFASIVKRENRNYALTLDCTLSIRQDCSPGHSCSDCHDDLTVDCPYIDHRHGCVFYHIAGTELLARKWAVFEIWRFELLLQLECYPFIYIITQRVST